MPQAAEDISGSFAAVRLPKPPGLNRPRLPTPRNPLPTLSVPEDLLEESGKLRAVPVQQPMTAIPETGEVVLPIAIEPPRRRGLGIAAAVVGAALLGALAVVAIGDRSRDAVVVPAGPRASLSIDVQPPSAKVTVDGVLVPGPAPFVAADLEPGLHRVSVSSGEAYLRFDRQIEVGAGAPVIVPIRLARREVELTVHVDPSDAAVTLRRDGQPVSTAPAGRSISVLRTDTSSYDLFVSATGYVSEVVPMVFDGSARQAAAVSLSVDPTVPNPTVPAAIDEINSPAP